MIPKTISSLPSIAAWVALGIFILFGFFKSMELIDEYRTEKKSGVARAVTFLLTEIFLAILSGALFVFSLALMIGGFLAGIYYLGVGIFSWLQVGYWESPSLLDAIVFVSPELTDWKLEPESWIGLHSFMKWIGFWIVSLLAFPMIGLVPLAISEKVGELREKVQPRNQ